MIEHKSSEEELSEDAFWNARESARAAGAKNYQLIVREPKDVELKDSLLIHTKSIVDR
jgi:hypothetical protein